MYTECPVGSYITQVSNSDEEVCVPCPTNSVSVRANSTQCDCLQGYYRNQLERPDHDCTGETDVTLLFNVMFLLKFICLRMECILATVNDHIYS